MDPEKENGLIIASMRRSFYQRVNDCSKFTA